MATVRNLTVIKKKELSPNMMRVVLSGPDLHDFPIDVEGGYVKLILAEGEEKPTVRSFTVRKFSLESLELTLDMVSHGSTGPAGSWARQVEVDEKVKISGPGRCQMIESNADWFLLAGDMSALPAIKVNLESLPDDASGHVFLEVISDADKTELRRPHGIDLHWIVNPDPELPNSVLEDTVLDLPWCEGKVSVWAAGEYSASRTLRQYFRHKRVIPRGNMYVSCYWKIGTTDEGMKLAKKEDVGVW